MRTAQRLLADVAPELKTVETLIRAWIEPLASIIAAPGGLGPFRTMIHLTFAADVLDERKMAHLQSGVQVMAKYLDVLERRIPDVDRPTLSWRMLCAIGGCYLVLGQTEPVGWSNLAGKRGSAKARRKAAVYVGSKAERPVRPSASRGSRPVADLRSADSDDRFARLRC